MGNKLYYFGWLLCLLVSCTEKPSDPLAMALASKAPEIKEVMLRPDYYEVQVIFSRIVRHEDSVSFEDYTYHLNDSIYYYPASTVKFPIAVLALEKLDQETDFDRDSSFFVEGDSLVTTFSREVEKIFAVSDNEANNRLFEYLGRDHINNTLRSKGIAPVRISHRLSVADADNPGTKPLIVYLNDSTTQQTVPHIAGPMEKLTLEKVIKGKGYYANDSLIMEPMNFSYKNYLPLSAVHGVLKRVIFPEAFPEEQRFKLSQETRSFLLKAMSALPKEAGYTTEEYYDSYGKFFIYGDSKEAIPSHIKIYNKVGYAYGYLTDCAYIKDTSSNLEFLLSATIHVNENKIFNDGVYEYDNTGIPFLAALGRELFKIEQGRLP